MIIFKNDSDAEECIKSKFIAYLDVGNGFHYKTPIKSLKTGNRKRALRHSCPSFYIGGERI